jgi:PleD family two-component response regulator
MNEFSDRRVMIVDDTKFNVKRLVMALRDEYVLDIATDGESALKRPKPRRPT